MLHRARTRLRGYGKQHLGPYLASRRPKRVDLPLATWDLRVTPAGTLAAGPHDLTALARELGTPLHVVRGHQLDDACDRALAPHRRDQGADIFYSYKTNPVPASLRRMHERGVGAEVISAYELWLAMQLGLPGDRIIYNGPAKSAASIRTAIEHGALMINANTVSEAGLISQLGQDIGVRANLGLRIQLPSTWGGQFGIPAWSSEIADLVRRAVADPATELTGLHFHRGIPIGDAGTMTSYVSEVIGFCAELADATGWHPAIIDLGGSLACPTVAPIPTYEYRFNRALGTDLLPPDPAEVLTIAAASELATGMLREHADSVGIDHPRVVLEPGRSLTGATQLLLTSVVDVKPGTDFDHAVLDAGINVAEPVRNEYHQLFSATAPTAPAEAAYRLAGPICTPADVLYNHWRLPQLEPGHVLAIMDSGAYFVPFSTTFSFPKAAIAIQTGDSIEIATRRADFADLVTLETW